MAESTRTTSEVDAETAQGLLLWARKHGFALTEMTVGQVRLALVDLKLGAADPVTTGKQPKTVHDAIAQEMGLPMPSDVDAPEDDEGEE